MCKAGRVRETHPGAEFDDSDLSCKQHHQIVESCNCALGMLGKIDEHENAAGTSLHVDGGLGNIAPADAGDSKQA